MSGFVGRVEGRIGDAIPGYFAESSQHGQYYYSVRMDSNQQIESLCQSIEKN